MLYIYLFLYIYIYKHFALFRNDTFTTKVFGSSMIEFSIREHRTLADSEVGELNFTPSEYVDEGRPFEGWLPLEPAGSGEIGLSVEVLNGLT